MKNCFSCKIKNECDFGKAVMELKNYSNSDDGLGIVVHLLIENIEQYVNCSYYEE